MLFPMHFMNLAKEYHYYVNILRVMNGLLDDGTK